MSSPRFHRRLALATAALAIYVLVLIATWGLSTRHAQRQTEGMLDYAILDLRSTVNGAIDTMLMHVAESIVEELGTAKPLSLEDARRMLAQRDIDEINVLDRTGRNLGSSDARIVGTSMGGNPNSAAFLVLTTGDCHAFSQPFRPGVHNPDAMRKYVGVAFPGGDGFVQVGIDEAHLTRMFPSIMGFIFDEWLLGEHGFFLCSDTETGRLISNPARHRDEATFLSETGYNPDDVTVHEDGMTTFRQRVLGEECDCRAVIFAGHRIIAALPLREYYSTRTVYTVGMAVLLAIVLSLFVSLLWRIDADAVRLQAFYAAEARKHAGELELGRTIQMAALPPGFPQNDYCRLSASMQPAQEVGGDFYDYFWLDESHLAFLVADVSGKGITGALYMMNCKTLIKDALLAVANGAPAEALTQVNAELCRNNPAEMFVTAWVGVLNLDTGQVAYANAGHNPPVVRRASGQTEWLRERSGCPLGCFDAVKYKPRETTLDPGDMVFLYTDGVTEAMDAPGTLFGDERLISVLRDGFAGDSSGTPEASIALVHSAVEAFADGAPQADDMTLLAMQLVCLPECYLRTFPAQENALDDATSFVEEKLAAMDCPPKARGQLLVAFDEVVSNVIRCSGATGFAVEMRYSRVQRSLSLSISDDGKPFDPLNVPPPDTSLPPEKREPGGLGLLLIRKLTDAQVYRHAHGCNILTLKKTLAE